MQLLFIPRKYYIAPASAHPAQASYHAHKPMFKSFSVMATVLTVSPLIPCIN